MGITEMLSKECNGSLRSYILKPSSGLRHMLALTLQLSWPEVTTNERGNVRHRDYRSAHDVSSAVFSVRRGELSDRKPPDGEYHTGDNRSVRRPAARNIGRYTGTSEQLEGPCLASRTRLG